MNIFHSIVASSMMMGLTISVEAYPTQDVEALKEEFQNLTRSKSVSINTLKDMLKEASDLQPSEANSSEIQALITNIGTEISVATCEIPTTLELLNHKTDGSESSVEQIITYLNSVFKACADVYQVAKVDWISSDRQVYRNKLNQLKENAEQYARMKSFASIDSSGNLTTFRNLSLFIDEFSSKIEKLLEFDPDQYKTPPWSNEQFSFQFYAGAEAVSVNDFLQETSARIGFQAYHRFSRKIENWRSITGRKCDLNYKCGYWSWKPGLHSYMNTTWTSVQDHTFVNPKPNDVADNQQESDANDNAQSDDNTADDTLQALVAELGVFLPFYASITGDYRTDNYHEFMIGAIINSRLSFTDETDEKIATQYYAGARLASNEEAYFDILVGKHEGIQGLRGEVRGQHPVSTFAGGRLFLGGRFNFGIDGDKDLNEDAWQVFLQWQTSFDELWQQPE